MPQITNSTRSESGSGEKVRKKISFQEIAYEIKTGNHALVSHLLLLNQDNVAHIDLTGSTLLHVAAKCADEEMLKILLGSSVLKKYLDQVNGDGDTALLVAAKSKNAEAVRIFLEFGADATLTDRFLRTPLHLAAENNDLGSAKEILRYISRRSYLDLVDSKGQTALMSSIKSGGDCAQTLINIGSTVQKKNPKTGSSVLHYSVIYQNTFILNNLLDSDDKSFLTDTDYNNNTVLQLAVHLTEFDCIKCILEHGSGKLITEWSNGLIHCSISNGNLTVFRLIADFCGVDAVAKRKNGDGQTPLMYAVALKNLNIVKEILNKGIAVTSRRDVNGNTVLHLAAIGGSPEIMEAVLTAQNVLSILNIEDSHNMTAYEIVLSKRKNSCFEPMQHSGLFSDVEVNANRESAVFVAAKNGNYKALLSLLLSDQCLEYLKENKQIDIALLKQAVWKGYLQHTDYYILTGEVWSCEEHLLDPKQNCLFKLNNNGRTIFHACALGGNTDCVIFICDYIEHFFPDKLKMINDVNFKGSTPLFSAIKRGNVQCAQHLIRKGANLCSVNEMKMKPVIALKLYVPEYKQVMTQMLNECLTQMERKDTDMINDYLILDYTRLCPPSLPQSEVVWNIYQAFKTKSEDVLQNPVIEYFVWIKWLKIVKYVNLRYYLSVALAILLSTCQICRYQRFMWAGAIFWFLKYPTYGTSVVLVLLGIPFICSASNVFYFFFFKFQILPPLLTLIYLHNDGHDRASLELGALAVLFSWLSVANYGIVSKNLSKSVAMFHIVVSSFLEYVPLIVIIIIAFSMSFFTLFHNYYVFNNILHSFLFTSTVLVIGEVDDLPTMVNTIGPFRNGVDYSSVTNGSVNEKKELRGMIVEGGICILFFVLVAICLVNMLVGLAVRGGAELEESGTVAQHRTFIEILRQWETFAESKTYRCLNYLRLAWICGVPEHLKQSLEIPMVSYPLMDAPPGFDLNRLVRDAVDAKTLRKRTQISFLLSYNQKIQQNNTNKDLL